MKFLFSFTLSLYFFFFLWFFLQFVAVDVATPSISSLNCLLLSTHFFALPSLRLFQLSFLRAHALFHSLETLYFRSAVFPTVFSRLDRPPRDFLYLDCFNVAFIWFSLAVTFLFSRFPTFRFLFFFFSLFSGLLFARIPNSVLEIFHCFALFKENLEFFGSDIWFLEREEEWKHDNSYFSPWYIIFFKRKEMILKFIIFIFSIPA